MSKLFELTSNYLAVQELMEADETSLVTLKDTLDSIEGAIEEKACNLVKLTKMWQGNISAIDCEINRLTANKKAEENRIKSVKDYLKFNMQALKLDKLKVGTFSISLQDSNPSLNIIDEKRIPAKYLQVVPRHYEPIKEQIKDALKAGKKVRGCELVQGKSLRIR